jgi:hypothetical protein
MPPPSASKTNQTPLSAPLFTLKDITSKGSGLPNRLLLHATDGWGKSSFGAMAPKPIFIQASGETGLETLVDNNQLQETPHFPVAETWNGLVAQLDALLVEQHEYRTLVIDTVNSVERLCHEHVCEIYYSGDWGEKGFTGYGRGYGTALIHWRELLAQLDRLRVDKRMSIILLCHSIIGNVDNPFGSDYGQYRGKLHSSKNGSSWELTKEWADAVCFGTYRTYAIGKGGKEETDPTKRAKAVGGTERILLTQRTAACDAKNRLGLPAEIDMGESPQEAWKNFVDAVKAAKEGRLVNA